MPWRHTPTSSLPTCKNEGHGRGIAGSLQGHGRVMAGSWQGHCAVVVRSFQGYCRGIAGTAVGALTRGLLRECRACGPSAGRRGCAVNLQRHCMKFGNNCKFSIGLTLLYSDYPTYCQNRGYRFLSRTLQRQSNRHKRSRHFLYLDHDNLENDQFMHLRIRGGLCLARRHRANAPAQADPELFSRHTPTEPYR